MTPVTCGCPGRPGRARCRGRCGRRRGVVWAAAEVLGAGTSRSRRRCFAGTGSRPTLSYSSRASASHSPGAARRRAWCRLRRMSRMNPSNAAISAPPHPAAAVLDRPRGPRAAADKPSAPPRLPRRSAPAPAISVTARTASRISASRREVSGSGLRATRTTSSPFASYVDVLLPAAQRPQVANVQLRRVSGKQLTYAVGLHAPDFAGWSHARDRRTVQLVRAGQRGGPGAGGVAGGGSGRRRGRGGRG